VALAFLVIRRGCRLPHTWMDHTALFVGIAGTILGFAVVFLRFGSGIAQAHGRQLGR
jgi:hypothetical protein